MASFYCNNRRKQSNNCFCNFYKRLSHNIETCYLRNKLAISIFAATVANTKSI